jgi:dolichol-phosphate mannosyltransferase
MMPPVDSPAAESPAPERHRSASQRGPSIAVIVPTLNERENVGALVDRLDRVLQREDWEVIFVDDDSTDGTAAVVRELGRGDRRVRCVQRLGRRGLSGACIEGMLASSAPYLAVIDGDLQHDEELLPQMLSDLKSDAVDVSIGSRYLEGGGVGDWSPERARMSRVANALARFILPVPLTDPMSGFFAIRRDALESSVRRLSGQGFKLLLDILSASPTLRVRERPFRFKPRQWGESKLDSMVLWEFAMLLAGKVGGRRLPARFTLFASIGALGVLVHLVALRAGLFLDLPFRWAQLAATVVAMTSNFWLNNVFTYRDVRLRGRAFLGGLLTFYAVCSVGAVANVGVAQFVYGLQYRWWIAGLAGAALGAVWNYAVSSIFTWGGRRRG